LTDMPAIPVPAKLEDGPDKRPKSAGDKLFDFLVYPVMNYIGTFVLTVVVADWMMHGKTKLGSKTITEHFESVSRGLEGGLKKVGLEKNAKSIIMTSVLMPGGSLMIIPVWIAEHFRTPLVATFNRWLGDKTPPATIDHDVPKQTFGSLIKGRLVAYAAVWTGMTGANMALGDKRFDNFSSGVADFLVHNPEKNPRMHRYARLAALDVFATAVSTLLLYAGSRFFAEKREEKIERRLHGGPAFQDEVQQAPIAENTVRQTPAVTVSPERELAAARLGAAPQAALAAQ
jgi:hypothetical protein